MRQCLLPRIIIVRPLPEAFNVEAYPDRVSEELGVHKLLQQTFRVEPLPAMSRQ